MMSSSDVIEGRFKRAGTFNFRNEACWTSDGPAIYLFSFCCSGIRVRVWMCIKSTDSWSFVWIITFPSISQIKNYTVFARRKVLEN